MACLEECISERFEVWMYVSNVWQECRIQYLHGVNDAGN